MEYIGQDEGKPPSATSKHHWPIKNIWFCPWGFEKPKAQNIYKNILKILKKEIILTFPNSKWPKKAKRTLGKTTSENCIFYKNTSEIYQQKILCLVGNFWRPSRRWNEARDGSLESSRCLVFENSFFSPNWPLEIYEKLTCVEKPRK